MKKISVVIPMFNEEEIADECYKRITNVMKTLDNYAYELLFINDGSQDNTLDILKDLALIDRNVKVISFSRNFGHQAAVTCGIKKANGDAIVIIDADLQDPPEIIPEMVKLWEEGNAVVYGKRKRRKGETIFKLLTAKIFYKIINKLSDVPIPKDTGDFRLIDKKIANVIGEMPEHDKYLRGLISWCGYKQCALEYNREERTAGKTKYSLHKMVSLAKDGIIGFSSKPLSIVGDLGILSIVVSFCILVYSLISYFTGKAIEPGWTSIMVTITFFTGIQLICLYMISEYIAKIYENSKGRPEYIIEEEFENKR